MGKTRSLVLHHRALRGFQCQCLEAVLFMRSMDYIGISQTIGRVIRKGNADKVFGLVCIPVYSNVGISTDSKHCRYHIQQRRAATSVVNT